MERLGLKIGDFEPEPFLGFERGAEAPTGSAVEVADLQAEPLHQLARGVAAAAIEFG